MAHLIALAMAILLHSVMGISYYFLLGKCTPAPMLGSWLFSASIVTILQAVHIFPDWWYTNYSVTLFEYLIETLVCCLILDLMLTKLWCRIEGLCHCAIMGILQFLITEDATYAIWEYWLLGLTTSVIGACLLCFTLWATDLPSKIFHGIAKCREQLSRTMKRNITQLIFTEGGNGQRLRSSQESEISFAG